MFAMSYILRHTHPTSMPLAQFCLTCFCPASTALELPVLEHGILPDYEAHNL